MKVYKMFFSIWLMCLCIQGYGQKEETKLKVLQLNLWHQCGKIENGIEGLIDIIDKANPDIILLCELNHGDKQFIAAIVDGLNDRHKIYYPDSQYVNVGVLSKYKPSYTEVIAPPGEIGQSFVKASFEIEGKQLVVYSAHLDYTHYECYLPRGYSGATWQKIDRPVTDEDSILTANRIAFRDEAIAFFIKEAQSEIDNGNMVILGGDFNEPSHLDWQEDTKNLYDHNGAVVNWDCSVMLTNAGYVDAYREIYPNVITHPGFTFPAGNKDANLEELSWAPEADERDRIDFIYYYPSSQIKLNEVFIVGPPETVANGVFKEKHASDAFFEPDTIWPTDHKGNLAVFSFYK